MKDALHKKLQAHLKKAEHHHKKAIELIDKEKGKSSKEMMKPKKMTRNK